MNGAVGAHGGEDYQQWMEGKVAQGKVSPQAQRHGGEVYSNTLPVRKVAPAKSKTALSKNMLFLMSDLVSALKSLLMGRNMPPARCSCFQSAGCVKKKDLPAITSL